jgi:Zn-finger nucleic acid-binding protein
MESLQDFLLAMELKYCERCGGLWLRPKKECGDLLSGVRAVYGRHAQATAEAGAGGGG